MDPIKLGRLTPRQIFAIEHAVDRSDGSFTRPAKGVDLWIGKWLTVLEVTCERGLGWIWIASLSRQAAPGKPYRVKEWRPEWHDEAQALFDDLLAGVGGETIDNEARLRAYGIDPHAQVSFHRWKYLTEDEIDLVTRSMKGGLKS